MQKRAKKSKKLRIMLSIALLALAVLALGIFVLKKPSIVGFAVITKETTNHDNLNLVVNESKGVTWTLKNPGNLQSVKATGTMSRNGTAKVYIQKGNEKLLVFDSTKQLFDVNVQVLPDYKKIFQGDELLIQITLLNLRGFGSTSVNVTYSIKDLGGNLVATEEESIFVETQAKFVRKLLIPSNLKTGTYTAFVEVKRPDGLIGTSSDLFEVIAKYKEENPPYLVYSIWSVGAAVGLAAAAFISLSLFRMLKRKKEIAQLKNKTALERIEKLEKELKALEEARKEGFISEASFRKNKKRIEESLGIEKE